jgi:hypothetical protein
MEDLSKQMQVVVISYDFTEEFKNPAVSMLRIVCIKYG